MIDVSKFVETLGGKPVAVFGLGLSGLATVKALRAACATVYIGDDNQDALNSAIKGDEDNLTELTLTNLELCKILILAPGVPLHFPEPHPIVKAARAANIEIISDIEILHRSGCTRKIIGITGTNGKSTLTALIAHILNESGIEAVAAGNIGNAALDIDIPDEGGIIVLELSSFQLDLCPTFRPDIAVLLDITPDHIDRHGSFEAYKAAKMQMLDGAGTVIKEENTHRAAMKVAKEFGVSYGQIKSAIKSFPGLPHRQQFIRQIGNVIYINDSKATNPESCMFALNNFDHIHLIAGGQAKEGGLSGIEQFRDKIQHVFLIGEDMRPFSTWLEDQNMPYTSCGALEIATNEAHEMAQDNGRGTVLLSPACASYDQFPSFEKRGERFTVVVNGL